MKHLCRSTKRGDGKSHDGLLFFTQVILDQATSHTKSLLQKTEAEATALEKVRRGCSDEGGVCLLSRSAARTGRNSFLFVNNNNMKHAWLGGDEESHADVTQRLEASSGPESRLFFNQRIGGLILGQDTCEDEPVHWS